MCLPVVAKVRRHRPGLFDIAAFGVSIFDKEVVPVSRRHHHPTTDLAPRTRQAAMQFHAADLYLAVTSMFGNPLALSRDGIRGRGRMRASFVFAVLSFAYDHK
jgi:hypothetical protein